MKAVFFSKRNYAVIGLVLVVVAGGWVYRTFFSTHEIQHVILISMDTTRWDALSCYEGGKVAKTPVIDAFATEGVLFEQAISPLPYTLPAHSSMLTGKIPPDHKVLDNTYYTLGPEQVTLAERLGAHGFKTAAFVSSFILDSMFGLDQGFDHYDDELGEKKTTVGINERRGDKTTARAIEWLGEHTDEKTFMFVHYYDPHMDYAPPEPFASQYQKLLPGLRAELQAYAGEVGFVDHCIGQLLESLEELGIDENTLICITADHGDSHDDHKEVTHGYFAYNATTQVPLIFKGPAVDDSVRITDPVGIVDIVPTLCSLLDIPITETIQGRDLTPYLTGKKDPYPDRSIFTQANDAMKYGGNSLLGIIAGDYKYIQTTRPELYHLAEDPGELNDMAADQPQRVRILQDRLRQVLDAIATHDANGTVELDAETLGRLESLGYLGGTKGMEDAFDFDQSKEDPKDLIDYHNMTYHIHDLIRDKEYDKAKIACKKYITMKPDFYMGYSAMAKVYEKLEDYPNAIAYLKKTVELDPVNEAAYLDLVKIYEKMEDFEGVRKNAIKLLAINSTNLAGYYKLAVSNFERGIYELPEAYLTDGMKSNEFYPKMVTTLADKLLEKGRIKQAFDLYRQSLERDENSEHVLNTLAWMAATSTIEGIRNPKQALDYALQVCELDGYQQSEFIDTLAVAYAATGDFDQAIEMGQKAVSLATQEDKKALAQRMQSRVRLYQSGKKYYDPGLK
jgi:arylsulfatase A-like enzyme/tetratricopeptide (TPR) repeat protein